MKAHFDPAWKTPKTTMLPDGSFRIPFEGAFQRTTFQALPGLTWCKQNFLMHYNQEADLVTLYEVGPSGVVAIVHGWHDWMPVVETLNTWRAYPDEEGLGAATSAMRRYMENSVAARLGLYALFGQKGRRAPVESITI